jgi:hypothetical protein
MLYKKSDSPDSIREGVWNNQKIRYAPKRIIVKFKLDNTMDQSLSSAVEAILSTIPKSRVLKPVSPTGRLVISVEDDMDILSLVKEISARAEIEYAEPDVIDTAQLIPTDTRYPDQWAHTKMNSPSAWDLETGSNIVLIGIIDSGISMNSSGNLDHPDLDLSSRYFLGTDFVDGGTPRDLNGHGTHVVGIAAGESNNSQGVAGMNWDSPVYICRTLDTAGNGTSSDFASAVEEIVDFAVARSYKVVINYSGGGADNITKRNACDYANSHGMIICAAAGNDFGGPVIFPAAYSTVFDGVIAVGSTNEDDTVSDFSNVGPEVTVVAPGRNILSTTPTYSVSLTSAIGLPLNYGPLDGTSMATPYVTGLVALMWSRHWSFTNTRIRRCLISTALKLGTGSFDNSWGNGRVQPEAALRCGDLIFPTRFTLFTDFTRFTRFTQLTLFTRFTRFTRFTGFTRFTNLTRFTPFTSLTRFTTFTRFTPFTSFSIFTPFTQFTPDWKVTPFVKFNNVLLDPESLNTGNFEELQPYAEHLNSLGFNRIDQLASLDVEELSTNAQINSDDAGFIISAAQHFLRQLTK